MWTLGFTDLISQPLLTMGFSATADSLAVKSGDGSHAARAGGEPVAAADALLLGIWAGHAHASPRRVSIWP